MPLRLNRNASVDNLETVSLRATRHISRVTVQGGNHLPKFPALSNMVNTVLWCTLPLGTPWHWAPPEPPDVGHAGPTLPAQTPGPSRRVPASQESRRPVEWIEGLWHPGSGATPETGWVTKTAWTTQSIVQSNTPAKTCNEHSTTTAARYGLATYWSDEEQWPGHKWIAPVKYRPYIYNLSSSPLDTTVCLSTVIGGASSSAHCNAINSQPEHWDRQPSKRDCGVREIALSWSTATPIISARVPELAN